MYRLLCLAAFALAACDIPATEFDEVFCDCDCTCADTTTSSASIACDAADEASCCDNACDLECGDGATAEPTSECEPIDPDS